MVTNQCRLDLTKDEAELFTNYLKEHALYFEPSENGQLVHFECIMSDEEMAAANKWLEENL